MAKLIENELRVMVFDSLDNSWSQLHVSPRQDECMVYVTNHLLPCDKRYTIKLTLDIETWDGTK